MSELPTKPTAWMSGWVRMASTASLSPWTTWKTPAGWVEVRDALTMGPRQGEDEITPHTRRSEEPHV